MTNIVTSYVKRMVGVTPFNREKIWPWKVDGVGLIETFKVGSVVDKIYKYMFVTVYDIKRIKQHKEESCNLIYECKRYLASKSAFTSDI